MSDSPGSACSLPTTAMADVTYVPGGLTAVTGDRCWVLVDATPDSPAVGWLWQQLGRPALPDALLAGLLGARFSGATDFALLTVGDDGRYRLFCRGAVTATVEDAGSASGTRVEGAGLLTWREHAVGGDARRIVLGTPPVGDALRLPAAAGVLLAGCVVVELAVPGAAVAPRPGAEPPRPGAVPHPDTVANGSHPGGQPAIVGYPDTITMTNPGRWTAPAEPLAAEALPAPPFVTGPLLAAPLLPTGPLPANAVPAVPAASPAVNAAPPAVNAAPPAMPPPAMPPPAMPPSDVPPSAARDEDYDFLWGATQERSVADAAIRQGADGEAGRPEAGRPLAFGEPGPLARAIERSAFAPPAEVPSPVPAMPGQSSHPAPSHPAPSRPAPGPHAPGGLIDAPPWSRGAGSAPDLLEETAFTVTRSALAGLARASAPPPDKIGPSVPALICPAGHANPPSEAVCRACGAPLPADPVVVPRPVLGVLRLSVGDVIALDRGVVMGRSPRADAGPDGSGGAIGEERPHVVKLPSADGDISRTHLRVTLDGWHVLVTDLNSTNGTLVTLPGREAQQLRPGEPMLIKPGTVVTLADGIDFRYEVSE